MARGPEGCRSLEVLSIYVLMIVALAACDGDQPEMVMQDAEAREAHQVLRVGHLDDGDGPLFEDIQDLILTDDGLVYVLDAAQRSIVVLGSDGRLQRSFGRQGEGPGEFARPVRFGFLADTIWVYDAGRRETSFFKPEGFLFRTRDTVRLASEEWFQGPATVLALFDQGLSLLEHVQPHAEVPVDAVSPVALVDRTTGAAVDTVTTRRVWREAIPIRGQGRLALQGSVSDHALVAAHPLGASIAVIHRRARGALHVETWDLRSRQRATFSVDGFPDQPLPQELADSVIDGASAALARTMAQLSSVRDAIDDPDRVIEEGLNLPERLPPVRDAFLSSDGHLWVERALWPSPSQQVWTALRNDGELLWTVRFPEGFTPLDARDSQVWGRITDTLGVHSVAAVEVEVVHSQR